jgi:curved DNA-binding protein CbpA
MKPHRTHYEVLGLQPGASRRQIILRYRELVRKFHPDIAHLDKKTSLVIFCQINVAYSVLRDEERRRLYDEQTFGPPPARSGEQAAAKTAQPPPQRAVPKNCLTIPDALRMAEDAYRRRKVREAEDLCRRIIAVEPGNAPTRRLLGDICFEQRKKQEALEHYRAAVKAGDKSLTLEDKIHLLNLAMRAS